MTSHFSRPIYFDSDGGFHTDYKNKKLPNSLFVSYCKEEGWERLYSISFKANLKEDRLRIAIREKGKCHVIIFDLSFLSEIIEKIEAFPDAKIKRTLCGCPVLFFIRMDENNTLRITPDDHSGDIFPSIEVDLQDLEQFVKMVKSVQKFIEKTKRKENED